MVSVSPAIIVSSVGDCQVPLAVQSQQGVRVMDRHLFTELQIFNDCLLVAS